MPANFRLSRRRYHAAVAVLRLTLDAHEDDSRPRLPDGLGGFVPTMVATPGIRVELDAAPGWTASFTYEVQGGVPVVASLMIHPSGELPAGGLTAPKARASFTAATRVLRDGLKEEPDESLLLERGLDERARSVPRRAGPKDRGDRFYADIAAGYVSAMTRDPRRPVLLLAEEIHLSPQRARTLVAEARRRLLLSAGRPGVAGGELTEKGRALRGE